MSLKEWWIITSQRQDLLRTVWTRAILRPLSLGAALWRFGPVTRWLHFRGQLRGHKKSLPEALGRTPIPGPQLLLQLRVRDQEDTSAFETPGEPKLPSLARPGPRRFGRPSQSLRIFPESLLPRGYNCSDRRPGQPPASRKSASGTTTRVKLLPFSWTHFAACTCSEPRLCSGARELAHSPLRRPPLARGGGARDAPSRSPPSSDGSGVAPLRHRPPPPRPAQVPNGPTGEVGAAPATAAAGVAPGGQGSRARRGSPVGGIRVPARLPRRLARSSSRAAGGGGTGRHLPGSRRCCLLFRSLRAGEALLLPGRPLLSVRRLARAGLFRCRGGSSAGSHFLVLGPRGRRSQAFALVQLGRAAEFGKVVAPRRRQALGTVVRKTPRLGCNTWAARLQFFSAARL